MSAEFDFVQSFSWPLHISGKSGTLRGETKKRAFHHCIQEVGELVRRGGDTNVFLFHRVKNLSGWVILGSLSEAQRLGAPVWLHSMCHFGCHGFLEVRSQLSFFLFFLACVAPFSEVEEVKCVLMSKKIASQCGSTAFITWFLLCLYLLAFICVYASFFDIHQRFLHQVIQSYYHS